MNWWEATSEQLNASPDLQRARQHDYYATLMATEHGRRVLSDLLMDSNYLGCRMVPRDMERDFAVLTTDRNNILVKCGIDNVRGLVDLLVQMSSRWRPQEIEPKKHLLEV